MKTYKICSKSVDSHEIIHNVPQGSNLGCFLLLHFYVFLKLYFTTIVIKTYKICAKTVNFYEIIQSVPQGSNLGCFLLLYFFALLKR